MGKCEICGREFNSRFWCLSLECKVTPRYRIKKNTVCEKCSFKFASMHDFLKGTISKEDFIEDYLESEE